MDRLHVQGPRLDELHGVEAHGEEEVGPAEKVPDDLVARHVQGAGVEGVVLGEDALGHGRDHHRTGDGLGEGDQGVRAAGRRGGAAGQDHGPAGVGQEAARISAAVPADDPGPAGLLQGRELDPGVVRRLGDQVVVRREVDRAGPRGDGSPERLAHDRGRPTRDDRARPLRDRREHAPVIHHLVGEVRLPLRARLAGDRQHGSPVHVGVGDGVDQGGRARTQGGDADPRPAGEHPVGLGHEAAGPLPAGQHEVEPLSSSDLHELDVRGSGIAEDVADPGRVEVVDDDLAHHTGLRQDVLQRHGPLPEQPGEASGRNGPSAPPPLGTVPHCDRRSDRGQPAPERPAARGVGAYIVLAGRWPAGA